jgi:molybdopterin converting factor small subunit
VNRWPIIFSSIIHSLFLGLLFFWSGPREKHAMVTYPSTVPIDVSVVSHVSRAPVSRPRSDQSGISHIQRKSTIQKKHPTLKTKKKKTVPKKKNIAIKKHRVPLKKGQNFAKKQEKKNKNQDLVEDLIDKVTAQEKRETGKNSFLKNLDNQNGGDSETPITDPDSDSDYGAPEVGPIAIGVLDKVQKILEKEWIVPFALKGGMLKIVLVLQMNKNGTIRHASVEDRQSTLRHPSYRVARDSAMKAVRRFYTTPLPLPLAHYQQWKVFEFAFVREENGL